jgi:hypothetical protein
MTQVMAVSKPGYDVLITDNKNLSFSSELATHSIYNVFTVAKLAGQTSVTITHSLGYIPKTWIFVLEGTAPNDFYRRIPQNFIGDARDYYITNNTIVIETDSTALMYFRVIIFTRSPNP